MSTFFDFFRDHWQGILVFGLLLLAIGALVQWVMWIFARGRFQKKDALTGRQTLRFVFADLLVKIIDDFRHLLALVIVVIFALALTYSLVLVAYEPSGRLEAVAKALQAVVSSLGGLIGAIIGYYFGEKAGEKAATTAGSPPPPVQTPQTGAVPTTAGQVPPAGGAPGVPPVQPAPPPPVKP